MAIVKRSGELPPESAELRRSVRADLRVHGREVLRGSLAGAAAKSAADAAAEMAAVGQVGDLSDSDYRNAKRGLMRSLRKAESKG
jgi:hypothetical protein